MFKFTKEEAIKMILDSSKPPDTSGRLKMLMDRMNARKPQSMAKKPPGGQIGQGVPEVPRGIQKVPK